MSLIEQLDLKDGRLVALCGAGGKTSLLYALGREWAIRKKKVVLTTTTHIQSEMPEGCALWDRPDEGDLLAMWAAGYTPVAGRLAGRKLKGPSEEMREILRVRADRIIVEADGAARLSALGRPLHEVCHRADLALEKGVLLDGPLDEAGLAALLLRGYGRYDPLFVLNQADDGAAFARGERVAALLRGEGHGSVILSLKNLGLDFKRCF